MAQWFKRGMAGMGALLFLVTSLSLTILVVWTMAQGNKDKTTNNDIQKALDQAKEQATEENALKGTKLSGFTPVTNVDSLQITDTTVGTGSAVKAGETITAHYTGALAKDGTVFESSLDTGQAFTAKLEIPSAQNGGQGLIAGWVEGIVGMKAGGTRRLVIPASLAYGEEGRPPTIGPSEPLVFDIQLVKIGQ